ncbi:Potassium channel [Polyrhizophydium stewartii]|uniref:Potassium channel n=1 Tax=Polyrhizophydium stewartii TaxID=2732419 RepID=A0ABR4NC65_9FUNG
MLDVIAALFTQPRAHAGAGAPGVAGAGSSGTLPRAPRPSPLGLAAAAGAASSGSLAAGDAEAAVPGGAGSHPALLPEVAIQPWFYGALFSHLAFFNLVRATWNTSWLVDRNNRTQRGFANLVPYGRVEGILLGAALACSIVGQLAIRLRQRELEVKRSPVVALVCSCAQVALSLAAFFTFMRTAVFPAGYMFSNGMCACIVAMVETTIAALCFMLDAIPLRNAKKRLTQEQRKLAFAAFISSWYIILGCLIIKYIEGWEFETATQFALATLLTIGYGNILAETVGGRIFFMAYTVGGLGIIAFYLVAFESRVVEYAGMQSRAQVHIAKRRREMRQVQRRRSLPLQFDGRSPTMQTVSSSEAGERITEISEVQREFALVPVTRTYTTESAHSDHSVDEAARKEADEAWVERLKIIRLVMYVIVWWFASALVFFLLEEPWTYFESLYFCFVTMTSIGFGDLVPRYPWAVEFWYIFIVNAVAIFAFFVNFMGQKVGKRFAKLNRKAAVRVEARERRRRQKAISRIDKRMISLPSQLPGMASASGFANSSATGINAMGISGGAGHESDSVGFSSLPRGTVRVDAEVYLSSDEAGFFSDAEEDLHSQTGNDDTLHRM